MLLCGSALQAQVRVEIVMEQEQFLRDESLPVRVRILNVSGQTLELGQDNDWLTFRVEGGDGRTVHSLGAVPVKEPYTLESSKSALRLVDLLPYFEVNIPGRYSVTAIVKIKEWNQEFVSKPKTFDIIPGFKLWEQEFGVPGSKGAPEVRKYILQQAQYMKRLMLYVRIADATDTIVYRVLPVGQMISFSKPECKLDKESNLHVLSQFGGWSFIYMVISPEGQILVRHYYEYTTTRPGLKGTDDGNVLVAGGLRRVTANDFPPPPPETSKTNEPPKSGGSLEPKK